MFGMTEKKVVKALGHEFVFSEALCCDVCEVCGLQAPTPKVKTPGNPEPVQKFVRNTVVSYVTPPACDPNAKPREQPKRRWG